MVIDVNQTFLDMCGYSLNNLLDTHIESTMSMANKFIFHSYFYPYIQLYGHVNELYLTIKSSNGEDLPVLINGVLKENNGEETIECVFVQMFKRIDYEKEIRTAKRQIEEAYQEKKQALQELESVHEKLELKQKELIELNEQLATLANTDSLTGLYNRRFFLEKLNENIISYQKSNNPFTILLLDIDYFKKINDTYGHLIGDKVLKELAELMYRTCCKRDIIARFGGEEFIILLSESNIQVAKLEAEKIRSVVEHADWRGVSVTVSIGAATYANEDTDISILAKADDALYKSKANGRNCVTHTVDMMAKK